MNNLSGNIIIVIGLGFILLGTFISIKGQEKNSNIKINQLSVQNKELSGKIDDLIREISKKKENPNTIVFAEQINNTYSLQEINVQNYVKTDIPLQEASIIFTIDNLPTIKESKNIVGITDNGIGNFTIVFDNNFPDENYYVDVQGNKELKDKRISKSKGSVSIQFDETGIDWIQVVCKK